MITAGSYGKTFEVDTEKRTIFGLAVPYGEPTFSEGAKFQFSRGVINLPQDSSRVKLRVSHHPGTDVGKATSLEETDEGLWARFSVARGPKGDEALQMAEDGVWDGLSIGLRDGAKFSKREGITHFSRADLSEISLTPDPAFSSARVAAVVAHAPEGNASMEDTTTQEVTSVAPAAFNMDAITKAISDGFASLPAPAQSVNPTAAFEVNEPHPYRFENGQFHGGGDHEFSADIVAAAKFNDREASERALEFVQTQFAVAQTNVQSTLPLGTNKVGFVDRREFVYPLTAALRKGDLANVAPFTFPRFNSLSGLVADHTEGVEPVPGALTTTSQTVTPKAMSGKVEITREVIDQASSPQLSGFIFSKMVRGYQEALEAAIVTELTAQAANITDVTLPIGANASGPVLVNSLIGMISDLQYLRGGYTFDLLATQTDLYKALATAQDSSGRNLLPALNPVNSMGTSQRLLKGIDIDGVSAVPVWALAATSVNRQNSWLIDSESVHLWSSAPQRLDFNFGATVQSGNIPQVALVTIAIWGYRAVAISDVAGVRQVTYDGAGVES